MGHRAASCSPASCPGLVLIGMLSAVAVTVAIVKKLPRQKFYFGELGKSFLLALPELFDPVRRDRRPRRTASQLPEVAALTVLYAVVLEVGVSRVLIRSAWLGQAARLRVLWRISREAMAMVGAIFIIIFASTALTNYMVTAAGARRSSSSGRRRTSHSKIVFLLAINVILLIVGTVMDIFSAIVVVLPLIAADRERVRRRPVPPRRDLPAQPRGRLPPPAGRAQPVHHERQVPATDHRGDVGDDPVPHHDDHRAAHDHVRARS